MFTRRHHEAIARAVAASRNVLADCDRHHEALGGVHEVEVRLANTFEDDNPRFDRARFLTACGIDE